MTKYTMFVFGFLCLLALQTFAQNPASGNDDTETQIGPWLDLKGPGMAVGPTQTLSLKNPDGSTRPWDGSLINGQLLPESGEGFVRVNSPDTSWGASIMISLLENASHAYVKDFSPNYKVHIASIAQVHGGPYGPHKSHENGLDGDVYYIGQTKYESVLDGNQQVTAKFDAQKNWDFWRLLVNQKILSQGKATSVVYMIFIHPVLKSYLCAWAKAKDLLKNPLDAEILRRMRPTEGHDTHFHLRLKCSPYYKDCYQQNEPEEETGCPA